MKTTLDLHEDYLKRAIDNYITSLNRAKAKQFNPSMRDILDADIKLYQRGLATIATDSPAIKNKT